MATTTRDDMEMHLLRSDSPERQDYQETQKKRFWQRSGKPKKPPVPKGPPIDTDYVPFDWKRMYAKKYIPLWIIVVLMLVATILIAVFQDKVVDKLRPFSDKVRDIPAGWLIPVALLFILSFPPLVGDEIVEILCGVIYGLWAGFGVVALGTYLGQIGNWFAFKYLLRRKAYELERTNLNYGAMARMVRDSGLWLLIVIRVSAIPPHISTAVFSTCNVKFWHYLVSTIFSLPRQIFLVYLGTLLVKEEKEDNKAQTIVMVVILVITVGVAVWLWKKMKAVKIVLLQEQEERRRAKQAMAEGRDEEEGYGNEWSTSTNDIRNDGAAQPFGEPQPYVSSQPWGAAPPYSSQGQAFPPGPYDPVPPAYNPTALAPNTARYDRSRSASPVDYNSRLH